MVKYWYWLAFPLAAVILTACNGGQTGPAITVEEAWARAPAMSGGNGAVYFRLVNKGDEADVLVSVKSGIGTAELHETTMKENDVMSMQPLGRVIIPAGGMVEFEPGGKHVMLIDVGETLSPGDKIPLTLRFAKLGEMRIEVSVQE